MKKRWVAIGLIAAVVLFADVAWAATKIVQLTVPGCFY